MQRNKVKYNKVRSVIRARPHYKNKTIYYLIYFRLITKPTKKKQQQKTAQITPPPPEKNQNQKRKKRSAKTQRRCRILPLRVESQAKRFRVNY